MRARSKAERFAPSDSLAARRAGDLEPRPRAGGLALLGMAGLALVASPQSNPTRAGGGSRFERGTHDPAHAPRIETSGRALAGYPFSLRVVQAEPGSSGILHLAPARWSLSAQSELQLVPGSTLASESFVVDANGCSPFLFGATIPPDALGQGLVARAVLADPGAAGRFVQSEPLWIEVEAKDTTPPPPGAPIPGSPRLGDFPTETRADAVEVRGFAPGSTRVEVQGPHSIAIVPVTGGAPVHSRSGGGSHDAGSPGSFRVLVPLAEDRLNVLSFTGLSEEGARSAPAIARIVRDERPPELHLDSPADGAIVAGEWVAVAGRVSDALSGLDGCTVTVDGAPAAVDPGTGSHGTFLGAAVPLEPGEQRTLTVSATDALGNRATRTLTVSRPEATGARLSGVAGDAQMGGVNGTLPEPLVVRLERAPGLTGLAAARRGDKTPAPPRSGDALANATVRFVVTGSDGRLTSDGSSGRDLTVRTDADGIALVHWTLGSDAGRGNDRVEVTSEGVAGTLTFCASALAGPVARLSAASGDGQLGEAGAPLAEPLRVVASDGQNPVPGVAVTFRVVAGGGRIDGESQVVRQSDGTGHAQVDWTLGTEPGVQLLEATYPGDAGEPLRLAAEALARKTGARTSASGVVLDPSRRPLGGATCTLAVAGVELVTTSDENGCFRFEDALSGGAARLFVDGGTATSRGGNPILAGSFPSLSLALTLVPGAHNPLPEPLRLPPRASAAAPYSLTTPTVLTVEGLTGLELAIAPGSMRVDGRPAAEGQLLTLTPVQYDEVPFALDGGVVPQLAWVLEPAGATFDPPAVLRVPNVAGLRAGASAWFLALDVDTQRLEIAATGAVTADGLTVVPDPGMGLTRSGWGAFAPPALHRSRWSLRSDVAVVGAKTAQREAARIPASAQPEDRYFTGFLRLLSTLGSSVVDSGGQDCVQFVDPSSEHLDPAFGRNLYLECVESYRQCVELILADGERKPSTVVDEPPAEIRDRARALADHMLERVLAARNARPLDEASLEVSFVSARRLVVAEELPATILELELRVDDVLPAAVPLAAGDGNVLGGLDAFGFEAPSFATVFVERAFSGGAIVRAAIFELAELPRVTASAGAGSRTVAGSSEVELPGTSEPGEPSRPVIVHEGHGAVHVSAPETFREASEDRATEIGAVPLFPRPVFPESIALTLSQDVVADPSTPVQARVTGAMDDGSTRDLSLFTDGTSYRSSHPELASIDPTGRITVHGQSTGRVLFTATNQGTTATGVLRISSSSSTTVRGFVKFANNTAAVGATVRLSEVAATTTTNGTGFFSFSSVPVVADRISVRARLDSGPTSYYAARTDVVPVPDGITDVGTLTLETGVRWITLANGSWGTGSNWSSGTVPSSTDVAILDVSGGPFVVTVSGGTFSAKKVICDESLNLASGGQLIVSELLDVTGAITVASGGTLNATVSLVPATGAALDDGVMAGGRSAPGAPGGKWTATGTPSLTDGVRMDADLTASGSTGSVTVTGGLTLNGTARLSGASSQGFRFTSSPQSLLGTGDVVFNGGYSFISGTGTLTIGPDISISALGYSGVSSDTLVNQGTISTLGALGYVTVSGDSLVNEGTISALGGLGYVSFVGTLENLGALSDLGYVHASTLENQGTLSDLDSVSAGTLVNDGEIEAGAGLMNLFGSSWTNNGTIRSTGGGQVNLDGSGTNNGTITLGAGEQTLGTFGTWTNAGTITAAGSTLTLGGHLTNTGTISVPTGTVNLGGVFTVTATGSLTVGTGPVNLTGTLQNDGQTFDITHFNVPLHLDDGGRIQGGTVVDGGGSGLLVTGSSELSSGVQMNANMTFNNGGLVTVTDGLTLNGTATLNSSGSSTGFSFFGTQSLLGTGQVVFNSSSAANGVRNSSGTLTIGPDITIRGQSGQVGLSGSAMVNQGTIRCDASARTIDVRGTGWINSNTIEATGGGLIRLFDSWTNNGTITLGTGTHTLGSSGQSWINAGTITAVATASTLATAGNWTNSGTISVPSGTVNLGGVFTVTATGSLTIGTGPVNLTGTLQNDGQTFDITHFNVPLRLAAGGRIQGGTVVDGGGSGLLVTGSSELSSGVQMNANMTFSNGGLVTVTDGLTLNGTATLNSSGLATGFSFSGTQSLLGTGQVVFNSSSAANAVRNSSGTLTIGPDITIRGESGQVGLQAWGLVNQGTIRCDTSARTIDVRGTGWINSNTIEATGGGLIRLLDSWTNNGTITLGTGAHTLGTSGRSWTNAGTITAVATTLTTAGNWTNSGTISVPTGTLNLGGVFTTSAWGNLTVGTGPVNLTGTLQNANETFDIRPFGPSVPFQLGNSGRIDGGTVVDGSGTGVLAVVGSSSLTSGVQMDVGMTLSGASVTVTGNLTLNRTATLTSSSLFFNGAQSLLGTGEVVFANSSSVTCSGALTIDQNILIHGQNGAVGTSGQGLLNRGTILVDGPGTISVLGTAWQNQGHIRANGGGDLSLQGSWTNNGTLSVAPTSTIFSTSGYTQTSTGKLSVQLGGTIPSLYGSLVVTGAANLGGELEVLRSGFPIASGNEFQVLKSGGVTGRFAVEPGGFTTEYNSPSAGDVNVVWDGHAADLVVSDVQGPPGGEEGALVTVTWTLRNIGPFDATGPWTDRILASADAVIGGDVLMGTLDFFGVLASGSSIQRTTQVALPDTPGTYRIVLSTDSPDLVFETDEGNNDFLDNVPFQVVEAARPDLVVDSVTGPAGQVVSGSTIQVTYTVRNAGAAATQVPNWHELVFLRDTAQLPSFLSGAVVDQLNQRFLQAGDAYTVHALVTLPRDFAGTRYLGVYADGLSGGSPGSLFLVEEEDEANNSRFSAPFQVVLEPQPDLVALAGSLAIPAIAPSGTRIDVTWTERNDDTPPGRGGPTDSGSWRTDIYLSNNSLQTVSGDTFLGSSFRSGAPLQPGAEDSTRTLTGLLLGPGLSGFFHVKLVVDAANVISELGFEANNVLVSASPIEVILSVPPDLEPTAVSGTSGAFGQPIDVTWSVHNRNEAAPIAYNANWSDEVYLSTDAVLNLGTDLRLVTSLQTAVSDGTDLIGDTYTKTVRVTLPTSLAPRQYFLIVRVDSANQLFEGTSGGESNNRAVSAAITVSGASPDLALAPNTVPGSHVPASGAPDQRGLPASWTVTNVGSISTSVSGWTDGIFLIVNGVPSLLSQLNHEGALLPGQSYQVATTFNVPLGSPGSFQLALRTNIYGTVFEGTGPQANNQALLPFQIVPQLPDLVVVSPSGPSTLVTGTPAVVSWVVQNVGPVAASAVPSWSDEVWLSSDQVLGSGDLFLAGRSNVAALGTGQAYAQPTQATITLPFGTPPGSYYVLVRADSDGRVLELDESNNVTALPTAITLTGAQAANLMVTAVTSPATVLSGQYLDVTWTLQNAGTAATNGSTWLDSVYLSRDGNLDPLTDTLIGTFVQSGALAAGASRQQTQSLHVNFGLQGAYFLFVATNSGNKIFEDGLIADNVGFRVGLVGVDLPAGSGGTGGTIDLDLTQVSAPQSAAAGAAVSLTWQLGNSGDTALSGAWTDAIYLSADGTLDATDRLVDQYLTNAVNLMPGQPQARQRTVIVPAVTPSSYHWIVLADVYDQVPEPEDLNRAASAATTSVTAIPLALGSSANATLATGEELLFQIDLPASRTVRIDAAHESPGAWIELFAKRGAAPTPGVFDAAGALPALPTQALVLPETAADTYYLLVRATAGAPPLTRVTLTATDLPFGVTSVSPTLVGRGRVTLQIGGSRFDGATQFRLHDGGGNSVAASEVEVVDAAHARVRFELAASPLGTYDVEATSTSSTSTLPGALGVESALPLAVRPEIERLSEIRTGLERVILVTLENTTNVDVPLSSVVLGTWDDSLVHIALPDQDIADLPRGSGETRRMAALLVRDLAVGTRAVTSLRVKVDLDFTASEVPIFVFARPYSEAEFLDGPLPALFGPYRDDVLADPDVPQFWRDAASDPSSFLGTLSAETLGGIEQDSAPDGFLPISAARAASTGIRRACALQFNPCGPLCEVLSKQIQDAASSFLSTLPATVFAGALADVPPTQDPLDPARELLPESQEPGPSAGDVVVLGILQSHDPNGIAAPAGIGPERYVGHENMTYTAFFENLSTATAPAGRVALTSLLGPEYDLSSFRLKRLRLGDKEFAVPPNKSFFRQRVPLGETSPALQYTAGVRVDPLTGGGQVFWELQATDEATGVPILNDPLVGILPPEDGTGAGRGFVEFSVQPRLGTPSGTRLETSAHIVFDENEVIVTDKTFNTLDADPPASTLELVSLNPDAGVLTLTVQGADASNGSGLDVIRIQASVDGSQFASIAEARQATISIPVERGRTYAFFSQAVDLVGNREPVPLDAAGHTAPDVVVAVPSRALEASPLVIDPGTGGTQILRLSAGPQNAGRRYRILGSMSGTKPGTSLSGLHVPLNQDEYFKATLKVLGEIPISAPEGVLDAFGRAEVRIELSPALAHRLAGRRIHHAFVLLSGARLNPLFDYASNAEPLDVAPPSIGGPHTSPASQPSPP